MKQKRKLRIFISNTFFPAKEIGESGGQEDGSVASWELRVEGRLLEDANKNDPSKVSSLIKYSVYYSTIIANRCF